MKYERIARELENIAGDYPEYTLAAKVQVYKDGTFKLYCQPSREAILKLAAKYRKGVELRTTQKKDWGVTPHGHLTLKQINSRYELDQDRREFSQLYAERECKQHES